MMDISKLYSPPAYAADRTAAEQQSQSPSAGVFRDSLIDQTLEMYAGKLFAGAAQRRAPSDAEIAALAGKYDPHNMSNEEYESFLDDLMDMGAISPFERQEMRASGLKVMEVGAHAWTSSGSQNSRYPYFNLWQADGDVYRWITDRVTYKEVSAAAPEAQLKASQRQAGYEALFDIVSRMAAMRPDSGGKRAEDGADTDLISQIADPDSAFYQDMFQRMRIQWEQSEEEKTKQAIIDALGAILDGMRSTDGVVKRKDMAASMAGLSKQISELDPKDPRRKQLDLFRQRLNQLGIFVDLDLGVKESKDKDKGWLTLTQQLIQEENSTFDPSIFDLI